MKSCIGELVLLKIGFQALGHDLIANQVIQLFQNSSSFGVCYSVENWVCHSGVLNLACNWVGGHTLVLIIAPVLSNTHVAPWVWGLSGNVLVNEALAQIAHEVSKAFIEPKIVPPLHGHQVAKPHVCQLMDNHMAHSWHLVWSWLLNSEDQLVTVGNYSWILHSSYGKLRTYYCVIFTPWSIDLEKALVKFQGIYNIGKYILFLIINIFL